MRGLWRLLLLLLLVVLVDLSPRVSSRNVDPQSDLPPAEEDEDKKSVEEESQNAGFFTTTISTLSNMLGLGNNNNNNNNDNSNDDDDVDDPDEKEDLDKASDYENIPVGAGSDDDNGGEDDDLNEMSPKLRVSVEDPEMPKEDARVYEEAAKGDADNSYNLIQGDEPPKEEDDNGDSDTPEDKEKDKEKLLEKEGPKPTPADKDSTDVDDDDNNADGNDNDPDDKEASDPKPKPKPSLEDKLDDIAAKEDEILNELEKERAEGPTLRRRNSTGLVLVDRLKPSSGQPVTLPLKPGDPLRAGSSPAGARNATSVALMSDYRFQPVSMSSINDMARYMRTCDSCLVSWDSFQCPLNDMAIELKKWITELEELLSFGCQLEGCDGSTKCCHSRDPAFERALSEMTDMARQMYNTFQSACSNCPRDGGWTEWCEWGACSSTCGPGTRTRTRQCNNPTPKGGGRRCSGLAIETVPCMSNDCCTDGQWSPWGSWSRCSATCGFGTVSRMRSCSSPPPNHCGRQCFGRDREERPCDRLRPCCVPQNGNWSPWTPWSPCPVSCGSGMRTRQRQCNSPSPNQCGTPCPGDYQDTEMCFQGDCCVHGNWGFWGPWTQCSATCDSGMRERRRECNNPSPNHCGRSCPGTPTASEPCYSNIPCTPICTDGNWGPWQPWSHCSATCGSGMSTRMRRCDRPAPNFCGQRCSGPASDTKRCESNIDCCVNGNWGNWEPWTRCSVTCGRGMRNRRRRCDSPAPNHCGRTCPGSSSGQDMCHERECPPDCIPLDGNWSPWSYWTPCSATCGSGMRQRTRSCSSPSPNRCGRHCSGPDRDSQRCQERSCCRNGNWGFWEPWSTVSVSCGRGSRQRRRRCDNPPPDDCGLPCPGRDFDSEMYDTGIPCRPPCLDGNWSLWSQWSPCSVTCGDGSRDRYRTCTNPAPNECGRTCPGSDRDMQPCRQRSCCIPEHGNWTPWTSWTPCPVTCGVGTIRRSRTCSNPPPNRCGNPCPGLSSETDRCERRDCCIPQDGNWTPWTSWTPCPVTCGVGTIRRSRTCSNPPPNRCGNPCPGLSSETDRCERRDCCIPEHGNWSPWSMWSSCPVTCGVGTVHRSRTCSSPPPNRCGNPCLGSPRETRRCEQRDCCVPQHGNWGAWSPWSRCPVTCGVGTRQRSRRCDSPAPNRCGDRCPGYPQDTERCDAGPCCVDPVWEPWGPWSRPGVTCGTATRERRRRCGRRYDAPDCNRPCPGPEYERESFDTGRPCIECIHGNWSPWGFWGSCSKTCGEGMQKRDRSCTNPVPNECGRSCMGPAEDMRRCNERPCCIPQDGNWGFWGRWSSCSVTCGSGVRERSRRCDSPAPNECGRRCPGSDRASAACEVGDCCVHGNWSPWGPWSQPDVTCDFATVERHRRCNNPAPNFCGRHCPGDRTETRRRDTGVVCDQCVHGNWGSWGPWSQPGVTCGQYVSERRRQCDSPRPNFCGRHCPGRATETKRGDTGRICETCIHGNWGLWGQWSQCLVTCGMGQRERTRRCNSPAPNNCGRPCAGQPFETELHRCGPEVGQPGYWSPWGPWGACSRTCGRGQQTRRRRCDVSACGTSCPGFDTDSQSCDQGPCCVPRQWGPWSPWSSCDVTCGRGRRTRRRTCPPVAWGDACGGTCAGVGEEVDQCINPRPCGQPPEWSQWNEWCPCECRTGTRARRRTCEERGQFGRGTAVDISKCGGAAREEEYCDVRQACPACVNSCAGRRDGDYPACTSCSDFLKCSSGRAQVTSCGVRGYEYDAFIQKCVTAPSPSCTLVDCISTCGRLSDGRYPSCSGCEFYIQCTGGRHGQMSCPPGQEFNAHSGRCAPGLSPTCIRAIRNTLDFMYRDAPAGSYFKPDNLTDDRRKEKYLELREKVGVASKFNRTAEDFLREEEEREKKRKEEEMTEKAEEALEEEEEDLEERIEDEEEILKEINEAIKEAEEKEELENKAVVIERDDDDDDDDGGDKHKDKGRVLNTKRFACHKNCKGLDKGRYQSCRGCNYFLVCTKLGAARHVKCHRHRVWDDSVKLCKRVSTTCPRTPTTKP